MCVCAIFANYESAEGWSSCFHLWLLQIGLQKGRCINPFLLLWPSISQMQLKEGSIHSGSWLEGTVHYVRNGSAAEHRVTGHVVSTVKKQSGGAWCLTPFHTSAHSENLPIGWRCTCSECVSPPQLNISRNARDLSSRWFLSHRTDNRLLTVRVNV